MTQPLPLMETRVRGKVTGFVAHVTVTQVFVNPYDEFIEATYVFPLPESAAVNGMVMHLAARDVVARIETREEAEWIYNKAVSTGRTAVLMNQERPNIFTQKVGNIPQVTKLKLKSLMSRLCPTGLAGAQQLEIELSGFG